MKTVLCFWVPPSAVGDSYVASLYVRDFCVQNPSQEFYYLSRHNIFFEGLENLKYISFLSPEFNKDADELIKSVNNRISIWSVIKKVTSRTGVNILFFNCWICPSQKYFNLISDKTWFDYDPYKHQYCFEQTLMLIKKNRMYNDMTFNYEGNLNKLMNTCTLKKYYLTDNTKNKLESDTREKILIFNWAGRSLGFNITSFLSYFKNCALNNPDKLYILATHDSNLCMVENIISCDQDLSIEYTPTCENLLQLWGVAKHCSNIYITPTGGCWTFLHFRHELNNSIIHMWSPYLTKNGLEWPPQNINYYRDRLNMFLSFTCKDENLLIKQFDF